MADSDKVKADLIVVGAGPAGLSAAYVAASAGLEVIVVERGEYAGAKNVSGLLYGTVLKELIPGFYDSVPFERPVSKRSITFLGDGCEAGLTFGSNVWSTPPYNNTLIVYRAQFDRWFAREAEEAGASLLEGMVVEGLVYQGEGPSKRVVGVKIRGDEDLLADVVVLADGANSVVSQGAVQELGLKAGPRKQEYAVGVKQIIALPAEKIQDRFGLDPNQGAALDFIGSPFEGLTGGGFIYTGKETLSTGFAAKIGSVARSGVTPNEIMNRFLGHSVVRKYVQGGELVEYAAHMLPEGGYLSVPEIVGNGLLIAGDAAGLVNMSFYHEGSNLAMMSGKLAGEMAVAAKERGDFSASSLAEYDRRLNDSFVMRDLKNYRDVPEILDTIPELFSLYPRKVVNLLLSFFAVEAKPKRETQRAAFKSFFSGLPKLKAARDLFRARKVIL